MNNLSKTKSSVESEHESAVSYKAPKNSYAIIKIKEEIKLKIEFKKGITQEQKVETLMAVNKSSLDYLASFRKAKPIQVYNTSFSSKTTNIKDDEAGIISANATFGYAATEAVPPPKVGGGPHREIFDGLPLSLQNNIKTLKSIKITQ